MSLNPNSFGAAQHGYEEDSKAKVREIYPGARTAPRVRTRTRRRLTGSEEGMATAEYAIATLVAIILRTAHDVVHSIEPKPRVPMVLVWEPSSGPGSVEVELSQTGTAHPTVAIPGPGTTEAAATRNPRTRRTRTRKGK